MSVWVVGVLTLSGCTLPNNPRAEEATQPATNGPRAIAPPETFHMQMSEVGDEYGGAVSWGDEAHVMALVSHCYAAYEPQMVGVLGAEMYQSRVRRCIEFDYLAYKDYQALTHRGLSGNPYFAADALRARWVRYGMRAGFTSAEDMFQWARDGYTIAKPIEIQGLRNRQGG